MKGMKSQKTVQEKKVTLSLGTGNDGETGLELTIGKKDESIVSIVINDESASECIATDRLTDKTLIDTEKILKDLLHGPKVAQTSEAELLEVLRQHTHWKIFREEGIGQEVLESLRNSLERHLGTVLGEKQTLPCGIVHITGGNNLKLGTVSQFIQRVQETLGEDAMVFVGCTVDEGWNEKIEVLMLLAADTVFRNP